MGEIFLREYDHCIKGCKRKDPHPKITRDHMFPVIAGREHPFLQKVTNHNKNLIPLCFMDHILLDKRKFVAYKTEGISGLVRFAAEDYIKAGKREVELLRREHTSVLLITVASAIDGLNGDMPARFREDYIKAQEEAGIHGNRMAEEFEAEGGFESLREWSFASCKFQD